VAATDVTSGKFSAPIVWIDRGAHLAELPMTLAVRVGLTTQMVRVPALRLQPGTGSKTRTLQTSPLRELEVITTARSGRLRAHAVRTDAAGHATIAISDIKRLSVVVPLGNGIETAEDFVTNSSGKLAPVGVAQPRRLPCRRTGALSAAKHRAVRGRVVRCAAPIRSKR